MSYIFNLVHIPTKDYPGKSIQREIISENEICEQFKLSTRLVTRSQKITKDDRFNAQSIGKSRATEQLS